MNTPRHFLRLTLHVLTIVLCLMIFAKADSFAGSPTRHQKNVVVRSYTGSDYDQVQDQRLDNLDNVLSEMRKSSDIQGQKIAELMAVTDQWMGGIKALMGLLGLTSIVGLGLQINDRRKRP